MGEFLFRTGMQMSFYGQFAAGESVQEVKVVIGMKTFVCGLK